MHIELQHQSLQPSVLGSPLVLVCRQISSHLVCSCSFDIKGACTKYSGAHASDRSADVIVELIDAGAALVGRTVTEELNLGYAFYHSTHVEENSSCMVFRGAILSQAAGAMSAAGVPLQSHTSLLTLEWHCSPR